MIGSNAVFEVPDIGAGVFQMSQQKKAEQERVKRERESEVGAYDASSAYYKMDPTKISPENRELVKAAFEQWEKAAVDFKLTGSDADKKRMQEMFQQFNGLSGIEMAIPQAAVSQMELYKSKSGVGFATTQEELDEKASRLKNTKLNFSIGPNGAIMVEHNGAKIPWTDHPRYSPEPNEFNSLMLDVVDPRSQYLDKTALGGKLANRYMTSEGVVINRADGSKDYNLDALRGKINEDFGREFKKKDFREAIYIDHYLKENNKNISELSKAEIDRLLLDYEPDGEFVSEGLPKLAVDSYLKEVQDIASAAVNANKPGRQQTPKKPTLAETFWNNPGWIAQNKVIPKDNGFLHIELNQKGLALPIYSGPKAYMVTRVVLDSKGKVIKFSGIEKNNNEDFMAMAQRYADQEGEENLSSDKTFTDPAVIKEVQRVLDEKKVTGEVLSRYGKGKDGKATTTSLPPITAAQKKALEAEASKEK